MRYCFTAFLLIVFSFTADSQITFRQKIGQLIMVTFNGDSLERSTPGIDTLKSDLANGFISGVTYFVWSNNLRTPAQITRLSAQLQQRASVPLFIAIDQEGGNVARLSASNGFTSTLPAYQLGTVINKESSTRAQASLMAGWLKQCGVNIDYAPVADVNVNPKSPAIGGMGRSFSAKPESVAAHCGWFIDEMHKKNIFATIKHFPGHGSAASDSHLGFTDISSTWSAQELIPFQTLISNKAVDLVMTGHLFNKQLDTLYPATLSPKVISELLRQQMGYDGVVITDAMGMGAISLNYGFEESLVRAVNAGVDLLLYTANVDSAGKSLARSVISIIEKNVADKTIDSMKIELAYGRVMKLKQRMNPSYVFHPLQKIPDNFSVGNYPNPFNSMTTIAFTIPQRTKVELTVFDLLGKKVDELLNEMRDPGTGTVRWNARNLPSGVYYVQLKTANTLRVHKIAYLK